ncbi:hypothetical protein DYH09_30605 [bacterium CPR1]|nr:hypothetical protein [bacterium CPR1]
MPAGAAGDFELKVDSYFGQPVPVGTPGLYAEISNQTGKSVQGRLEARFPDGELAGWVELELPAGSRRHTDLRLSLQPRHDRLKLDFKLLVEGRLRAVQSLEIRYLSNATLVLSPEPSLLGLVNAHELRVNQLATSRAVLRAPESSRAYLGASRVVLHDRARLALSELQMAALADFARSGGELVFIASGDPNEYRGTPLEAFFPMRPRKAVKLKAGYELLTGSLRSGDAVLVMREGHPLMIVAGRGLGRVYLITAEMTRPQLLGEKTSFALLDRMFAGGPNEWPRWQPQELWGLSHADRIRYPAIALALGSYFLAAGPLNFWFLRKRQRRVWALVTLPLLSLTFSALIVLYTAQTRGFEPRLEQFGLLRLESGQIRGLYEATIFLDTLWEGRYTLECGAEADLNAAGSYYGEDLIAPETGLCNGRLEMRDLRLNAWSGTTLLLTESCPLPGPITLELERQGGRLVGHVQNDSGLTLQECQFSDRGLASELFRLEPGRKSIAMALSKAHPRDVSDQRRVLRDTIHRGGGLWLTGFLAQSPDPVTCQGVGRRHDHSLIAVLLR